MIDIFKLFEDLKSEVNVHQGGHIRPRIFIEWVEDIQIEIYNELIDEFQKTQQITDKIYPFLLSTNVVLNAVKGKSWDIIKYPIDYENFASCRIVVKNGTNCGIAQYDDVDVDGNKIEKGYCSGYIDEDELAMIQSDEDSKSFELPVMPVDNDRWGAIHKHLTKKPTYSEPKMTQYGNGWKISPKNCATNIVFDYFRLPKKPVYNYIVINEGLENEYFQFVPTNSVNLEWSEKLKPEFILRLKKKYFNFTSNEIMSKP